MDGSFYLGGVDADADEARHVGHGVFIAEIEGHGSEFWGDVVEIGQGSGVEGEKLAVLDEGFDGVFAGLNEIVLSASCEELAEHFFVGGVVFHGDLDASFLGEVVDDGLGNIFGPTEQAEFLWFGGSGSCCGGGSCGA